MTDQSLAGARLQVEDDNNAPLSVIRQDIVKQKTPSEVNNGWQRITTVVNVNTAGYYYVRMVMARCRGTVYFDEIQLNRGEGESSYNFIENSDFTYGISDATNAVNASYSDNGSQHNNGYYADALVLQGEPHQNVGLFKSNTADPERGPSAKHNLPLFGLGERGLYSHA